MIDKAEQMSKEKDRYVELYWDDLETALKNANDVMLDENALQEDVDQAATKLLNAILKQRFKANKENLEDLIKRAEGLNLSEYTEETVRILKTALENANAIFADSSLSIEDQQIVDAAAKNLETALNGLKKLSQDEDDKKDEDNAGDQGDKQDGGNTEDQGDKGDESPATGDALPMVSTLLAMISGLALIAVSKKKQYSAK